MTVHALVPQYALSVLSYSECKITKNFQQTSTPPPPKKKKKKIARYSTYLKVYQNVMFMVFRARIYMEMNNLRVGELRC